MHWLIYKTLLVFYGQFFSNYIGTGKGGQSIWGRKFEDELRDGLKVSFKGR